MSVPSNNLRVWILFQQSSLFQILFYFLIICPFTHNFYEGKTNAIISQVKFGVKSHVQNKCHEITGKIWFAVNSQHVIFVFEEDWSKNEL